MLTGKKQAEVCMLYDPPTVEATIMCKYVIERFKRKEKWTGLNTMFRQIQTLCLAGQTIQIFLSTPLSSNSPTLGHPMSGSLCSIEARFCNPRADQFDTWEICCLHLLGTCITRHQFSSASQGPRDLQELYSLNHLPRLLAAFWNFSD